MSKIESRQYQCKTETQERAAGDGVAAGKTFVGYPIRFNELSDDVGGFKEIILRSAWDTADFKNCLAVFNHKEDNLLGSYAAGTLRFKVTDEGVYTEVDVADTSISRDCQEWVNRGEVSGQSFKFRIAENGITWSYDEKTDTLISTISAFAEVLDVSLVTRPAYNNTSVSVRSADLEAIKTNLLKPKEIVITEENEREKVEGSTGVYNYYLQKTKERSNEEFA